MENTSKRNNEHRERARETEKMKITIPVYIYKVHKYPKKKLIQTNRLYEFFIIFLCNYK